MLHLCDSNRSHHELSHCVTVLDHVAFVLRVLAGIDSKLSSMRCYRNSPATFSLTTGILLGNQFRPAICSAEQRDDLKLNVCFVKVRTASAELLQ
jgi:hypothetical protein